MPPTTKTRKDGGGNMSSGPSSGFFERYTSCRMGWQVRRWSIGPEEAPGQLDVSVYCYVSGVALSDSTGRTADLPVWFPYMGNGEVLFSFVNQEGVWRISRTSPAFPNLNDLLGFSMSPFDPYAPGPDTTTP